ncbi:MAG TPA: hypothetical protein VHE30_13960 [Polyangiaceae bacterium]|nr:hypothetical protein [Polyangiaceae bacterium]
MASVLRAGFALSLVGLTIGLLNGCGSSDSKAFTGNPQVDGGGNPRVDSGTPGSGGSSNGGGAATGGGGGQSTGGTSNTGGSNPGSGGANGPDGGSVACTTDAPCTPLGLRCDTTAGHCVACLFDNECTNGARCLDGSCQAPQTCDNSVDCRSRTDGRTICDATTKVCVECAKDVDCKDGKVCAVDTCVPSSTCTPGDSGTGCASGLICTQAGKCVQCEDQIDCGSADQQCIDGTCLKTCQSDNDCSGTLLCDTAKGGCVQCLADTDCADIENCQAGKCVRDVCAQGVKSCVQNSVVECKANGSGIAAPVACPKGQDCVQKDGTASCVAPSLPDGGTPPPATCSDQKKNGTETDVDCGGSCKKCGDGDLCAAGADCTSNVCQASCSGLLCFPGTRDKVCRSALCTDQTKNGAETDVDCGGADCARCAVGKKCAQNSDCEANVCQAGTCVAAKCTADQCPNCFFPTDAPCCKSNGLCGCATTFPFQGSCQ